MPPPNSPELVGKVSSVFSSSATQHGGQESTILTFHPVLLHLGMIIVGLPLCVSGPDGRHQPSKIELDGARFQGRHLAQIAAKVAA
jgi:NAD(P)H dehydrogenase (quinone)